MYFDVLSHLQPILAKVQNTQPYLVNNLASFRRSIMNLMFNHVAAININWTSSSAIAEGPRDALSQLKSCQLLHNCTKNHIW